MLEAFAVITPGLCHVNDHDGAGARGRGRWNLVTSPIFHRRIALPMFLEYCRFRHFRSVQNLCACRFKGLGSYYPGIVEHA